MLRFLLKLPRRSRTFSAGALLAAASISLSNHNSDQPTLNVSSPLRRLLEEFELPSFAHYGGFPSQNTFMVNPPLYFALNKSESGTAGTDVNNGTAGTAGTAGTDGNGTSSCKNCLGQNSIANAAALAGPAVVNIAVSQGINGMILEKSIGSGTIINPNGTILTCANVVAHFRNGKMFSKGKVSVTLQDGREFEALILNADFHSDIAVLKINSKSKINLPFAKIGSSSKLRPGDWVLSLGCPLSLQNTVTAGIVSCVDRKSSDLGIEGVRREYLQTDCAINQGNSGGPLVNLDGEIVGVNVMKVLSADGVSFAVPIDSVVKIMDHFQRRGRVVRPWLGLKMLDLNEMIISQLKERDRSFPNLDRGVLVPMVIPGSPAELAGFRPGDVVIEFGGKSVQGIKEIVDIMGDKVGEQFEVRVIRSGDKSVKLYVIPEEADPER